MKDLADVVAGELQEHKVSYAVAAMWTNYSPSAISNYLNRKRAIPQDFIGKLAHGLKSARLKIIHSWLCGCGFFKTQYLAGVDDHPVTVKTIGIRELWEAMKALEDDPVENRMRREDFTQEQWAQHERASEQLYDIHALIEKRLESEQKYYDVDPEAMQKKINAKLDARGYTKEKPSLRKTAS